MYVHTVIMSKLNIYGCCAIAVLILALSESRPAYATTADRAPEVPLNIEHLLLPMPQPETRSKYGNNASYEVFGETYRVAPSAVGYKETGMASWYGEKFHGKKTSSGDIYNMYRFTAAHRSLPVPTWVKVTNLENGIWLYVRVNDRGPFHRDRIIDLSYAAAAYLNMLETGTARVAIEHMVASAPQRMPDRFMLQVRDGYLNAGKAGNMANVLAEYVDSRVFIEPVIGSARRTTFRVHVGSYRTIREAQGALQFVQARKLNVDMIIVEKPASEHYR